MVPGRTRRRSLIHLAGAAALGALAPPRLAAAEPLSGADMARLSAGELVRVPIDLDLPAGDYLGGLSYAVIHARPADVMAAVTDPAAYRAVLPMTLESRLIARRGPDMTVFLRQGTRLGSAGYALTIRPESESILRYWLDPSQPHEIADLWGYFRVLPWAPSSSLLTYAALLHLDTGLVKLLFSQKIREIAMTTPALVRAYVEGHRP